MNKVFRRKKQDIVLLKLAVLTLVGIILPWVLIPIIKIIKYSELIEEISKALVVLFLIINFSSLSQKIKSAVFFGFLFGLSESLFYLNYACQLNNMNFFWLRIALTVPMHIITVLVLLFSALKNKKTIILGIIGSLMIHLAFNAFVVTII